MKKIWLLLAFVLNGSLSAGEDCYFEKNSAIEYRCSAFIPQSERFRKIYNNCCFVPVEVEVSTKILGPRRIDLFGNISWFSKNGHSLKLHNSTRLEMTNFVFGLNMPFELTNCFSAYMGAGPCLSWVQLRNKSRICGNNKVSRVVWGGDLRAGVKYFITEGLLLDVFVDYLYLPTNFRSHANVGGFKPGLGIGYAF